MKHRWVTTAFLMAIGAAIAWWLFRMKTRETYEFSEEFEVKVSAEAYARAYPDAGIDEDFLNLLPL